MKRFLCILCCVLLLFSSFSTTAFAEASTSDLGFDLIKFGYDMLKGWFDDTNEDVQGMTGDEFYNWYTSNRNFDSALWRGIYGSVRNYVNYWSNGSSQRLKPRSITDQGDNELGLMKDGKYNAVQLSKDIVESLNAEAVDFAGNEFRSFTLEDIHLYAATNPIRTDYVTVTGKSISNIGTKWTASADLYSGYYNFTFGATSNTIIFYPGGAFPPAFYLPSSDLMYQNGVALPSGVYFVIGDNSLIRLKQEGYTHYGACYYGGDTTDSIIFGISQGSYSSSSGLRFSKGNASPAIYSNGVESGKAAGWSYVDLWEKMSGYVIDITGDAAPPETFLPDDIPYDDDDNVMVLIPDSETGGDIIYMSPTDYDNYVNNGTFVEGDYINNFGDETINNITYNYNNYITNNTTNNNGSDSSYDDTTLLRKIDIIIDKLDKIIKKMRGKVDSSTDITFNIGDLLGVDDDLFDLDVIELDWKTLVQTKLPLLAEASQVVRDFEKAKSPLSIESEIPLPGSKETIKFAIDFTWYDNNEYKGKTGREYVREGLSYLIYVVAFIALYRRTDSIFSDY